MLSKRALSTLTRAQRHQLRSQWLRSGQCARCFHASIRRRADYQDKDTTIRQIADESSNDADNDNSVQQNAPKPNQTRHQRAAQASEEIRMLQRDRPSTAFGEADPNTLRPPGAGGTVDPEAVGLDVRGGSMGANDAPQQDGPLAQGIDINARNDVDAGVDTRAVRKSGVPFTEEDPSEKVASSSDGQLESGGERLVPQTRDADEDEDISGQAERSAQVQPDSLSAHDLVRPYNSSTVATSNFSGIISDHISRVASPGIDETNRDVTTLANKLMAGQLVHFNSKQEKAAVLETAKVLARRRAAGSKSIKADKAKDAGAVQSDAETKRKYTFAPIPSAVQKTLVDKMVAGRYDAEGLLDGQGKEKQPVLNEIRKAMMMNSTYLTQDADRVVRKVKSLLPTTTVQSSPQQRDKGEQQRQSS